MCSLMCTIAVCGYCNALCVGHGQYSLVAKWFLLSIGPISINAKASNHGIILLTQQNSELCELFTEYITKYGST